MRTFILLAVVVAVASAAAGPRPTRPGEAAPAPHRDTPTRGEGSSRRAGSGGGASGYGAPSGSYGGYYAPPPSPHKGDGLDKLDKLFSRVDAVSDQLKTVSEQVVALEARQAVQVRFFDHLVTVTLEALGNTDENQYNRLTQLEAFLKAFEEEFENELEPSVNSGSRNDNNRAERLALEQLMNEETQLDIGQSARIARLVSITADFKDRLFQIKKNEFKLFDDEVERTTQDLNAAQAFDDARTCEVGELTLDDDECTAELTFQTDFGKQAPQIFLGLKGANFNTNAVEDEKNAHGGYGYSQGYGHSQGYHETEPGSIGTRLNAYTTPKGARFEFFFFGFGETRIVSATIQYQVCSIGPGIKWG